ncbi:MAG: aldehyde dehydrogenase family protein [Clostridia bacterium]|nr:aldehyde dehydrogenase family protein [Clostridia bacterium]
MEAEQFVKDMVAKARAAQEVFEGATQQQVDELVRACAKAIFDNAETLARMAVDETRMGVYEDKVKKNMGKARVIWNELKGKKSVGIIRELPQEGLVEVAKPMGVVGAVTPTTNPIVTPMCNAMFAIKGRNAIIICPHPRSKKCSYEAVRLMNEAIAKTGAPENLIQCVQEPTVEVSGQVMKQCDVCISTGGMGMVKAAYSSGRPAFGVGAGNVQCLIDEDVDLEKVVPMIIEGRRFDNGIICSGEQTAIMPKAIFKKAMEIFEKNAAYYVHKPDEVARLRDTIFPGGITDKNIVGQDAAFVAKKACIDVPEGTKVLIVKADGCGKDDLFSREKMCPVIATYDNLEDWEACVETAYNNLCVEGKGHSVCIHSNDTTHIEKAALRLPVSRFLINQICSTNNGGSFFNGLSATTTLGCGSWGNNSISENLSWKHLFNVSRIAYIKPGSRMLTDDEIWG